jgi:pimeloyl-ACP methyl ester carboxylesterase
MTNVLVIPGSMSFSQYGESGFATVKACAGGPQAILNQLGDHSTLNVVEVKYNDYDTIFGASDGANKIATLLKELLLDSSENVVVVGHSYGAVSSTLLIQNAQTLIPGIDPNRVKFINFANSIRANTGLSTMLGLGSLYGNPGPVTTKFQVIDVALEYDRWADYPNSSGSQYYWQAVNNVNSGDSVLGANIHNHYEAVRLDGTYGSGWTQRTIGSVKFMFFETPSIPSAQGLTRSQLAQAYNRIVAPTW